jgi:hypothetical protein
MPGEQVTANLAVTSPALRQVKVEGDHLADAMLISLLIWNPTIGGTQGLGFFNNPGKVPYSQWKGAGEVSEAAYIAAQNAGRVDSVTVVEGTPDTVTVDLTNPMPFVNGPDPSGLEILQVRAFHPGANYFSTIMSFVPLGSGVTIL